MLTSLVSRSARISDGSPVRGRAANSSNMNALYGAPMASISCTMLAAISRVKLSAMTVTFSEGWTLRQTRTALRAPIEYSGSKSTRFNAVGAEIFCRIILLVGSLQWYFAGFHQPGLSLEHHVINNTLQISRFLEDAQLAVGAGTVLQDAVHVSDLFPAVKLVDDVVHELKVFQNQVTFGDFAFFAEVDQLPADAITRGAPLVLHDKGTAILAETLVARVQLVQFDHRRLNQSRQRNRLVKTQRDIADPDLERVKERMRPDVPPDLLRIVDALGADKQVDKVLEITPACEGVRNVGAREFVEDFAAIGFQAGIHAQPERRVSR